MREFLSRYLSNNSGILQTKCSHGEGHESRRGGLEAMPLDQHIKCGYVTGCKFSVAPMLRSSAQIAGNRLRRERCAKKKAWDSEPA